LPTINSHILGTHQQGDVIDYQVADTGWVQIHFNDTVGFVAERYIEPIPSIKVVKGRVTASLLNVRAQPTTHSLSLGAIARDSELSVLALLDNWLEIEFNDGLGYVSRQFVALTYHQPPSNPLFYQVSTELLNVRASPTTESAVIGQLHSGSRVNVSASLGHWLAIRFNGFSGFVAAQYLRPVEDVDAVNVPLVGVHTEETELSRQVEHDVRLDTDKSQLPVVGDAVSRKVASTWNRHNPILTKLSDDKSLDVACAIAVICVESSGKGFERNNDNRMIIRFENHKFWKYWGKFHPDEFWQHFKSDSEKIWQGHQFRGSSDDPWSSFHGSQHKEWSVFEFARAFDERAAMLSISMGASQIMGFNYDVIGYSSVQQMFNAFAHDINAHFEGLFDFCSPSMLENLRQLEFEDFAARYNGSGQKEKYGRLIQRHYKAFKTIMK
jgi:uncharacterized protein YraI